MVTSSIVALYDDVSDFDKYGRGCHTFYADGGNFESKWRNLYCPFLLKFQRPYCLILLKEMF